MSESGAFEARLQTAVACGDNLSNPALEAASPTSEWVRLSIAGHLRFFDGHFAIGDEL